MNESTMIEEKKTESNMRMYIDGRDWKYKVMSGLGSVHISQDMIKWKNGTKERTL